MLGLGSYPATSLKAARARRAEVHAALESSFNVARVLGHARSTLVDQVYAHSLQSGMASVAERVTARALGEQPKLRVIEGRLTDDRRSLDESPAVGSKTRVTA